MYQGCGSATKRAGGTCGAAQAVAITVRQDTPPPLCFPDQASPPAALRLRLAAGAARRSERPDSTFSTLGLAVRARSFAAEGLELRA